jgi:hypothetical protein
MQYKILPKVIYRKIDNEYYVLEPDTNTFINFNEVGNFIFEKIAQGLDEKKILEEMVENFDTDKETAREDLDDFIKELLQLKILAPFSSQ